VNRIGHQGLFFERFLLDPNDTFATPALDPNAVGVYLTRNRPYSPRLARWLSRDMNESAQPVVTALAMNGQTLGIVFGAFSALGHYGDGMSLYQFAGSNPVNRRDPLGLYYDPFAEVDDFLADRTGNAMYWIGTLNSMAKAASIGLRTAVSIGWGFLPGSGLFDAFRAIEVLRSGKGGFWEALDIAMVAFPLAKKGIEGITALRGLARTGNWIDKACNCFVAGTLVVTSRGEIPIEQVGAGDVVLSRVDRDPNGPADWAVVTQVFESVGDGTLSLTLEDGRSFTVTLEHEVWTFEGGWQPAREVEIAEHVRGLDDTPLAVISIDVDRAPRTVYNLEVAGARTYFAEGVWVHNNSCNLKAGRRLVMQAHHAVPKFLQGLEGGTVSLLDDVTHRAYHGGLLSALAEGGLHKPRNQSWGYFFDRNDGALATAHDILIKYTGQFDQTHGTGLLQYVLQGLGR
jgi:hypothetical protein